MALYRASSDNNNTMNSTTNTNILPPRVVTRLDFQYARRIVVKLGTSVVSSKDGEPALGRIASIIEQICDLKRQGKQVLLVTSGSIGIGRQKLDKQILLSASLRTHVQGNGKLLAPDINRGAYAAAGQIGLMSLYETLFSLYDVACSQVLVTDGDFKTALHRDIMRTTMNDLMDLGVLPIVNENDAVSASSDGSVFTDNDSLASLVAGEIDADLLLLLTDVDGLYNKPPTMPGAKVISIFFNDENNFEIGEKSNVGRGGMGSKIQAAQNAVNRGVRAVVIASGYKYGVIGSVLRGDNIGTLFVKNPVKLSSDTTIEDMAIAAREASRKLQQLSSKQRQNILHCIAKSLLERTNDIMAANEKDMDQASANTLDSGLLARLKLSPAKLQVLAKGIQSIAEADEPIGRLISRTELASGLHLQQETCPIGVLLVIFESRPDSLPQIASLAIRSGNGILLKGGKEAKHSNTMLHKIIVDAVAVETKDFVPRGVIGLVTSREEVSNLLKLDNVIDLCIPRGSGALVKHIKANTRIPVLGHAEGVCHVFINDDADLDLAVKIAIDSKTDYPAACNALETLLIHKTWIEKGMGRTIFEALQKEGIALHAGPNAVAAKILPSVKKATSLSEEYGALALTVEIVDNIDCAIAHINEHGSHHTESIVTRSKQSAEKFLANIDSACVFHNASTRFADGFRFGLGAEVGISTGRIHARGPVGVEGLLTTKWLLRSDSGHVVSQFSDKVANPMSYTHKKLSIIADNGTVAKPKSSRL